MIFAILYVSRSLLLPGSAEVAVQDIVDRSTRWNTMVGITGALIFTEQHFAQFIEGPEAEVQALMGRLMRDPRHTAVTIRRRGAEPARRFEAWGLAYSGPAMFLAPNILPLTGSLPADRAAVLSEDLILLMQGFSSTSRG